MKRVDINHIPYEILIKIFAFLKVINFEDYVISSFVCRKWRQILYKDIDVPLTINNYSIICQKYDLEYMNRDQEYKEYIINHDGLLSSNPLWIKICKFRKLKYAFQNDRSYYFSNNQFSRNNRWSDIPNKTFIRAPWYNYICQCKGLSLFYNLINITIIKNDFLKNIDFLEHLPNIKVLILSQNKNLKDVSKINYCEKLQQLELEENTNLLITNLKFLKCLTNITHLSLDENENLTSLNGLENNKNLKHLSCVNCYNLQNSNVLKYLHNITVINLSACYLLNTIPEVGNYEKLIKLDLSFCDQIQSLNGIEMFTYLVYLNIEYCELITDFSPLEKLNNLDFNECQIKEGNQITRYMYNNILNNQNPININNLFEIIE